MNKDGWIGWERKLKLGLEVRSRYGEDDYISYQIIKRLVGLNPKFYINDAHKHRLHPM